MDNFRKRELPPHQLFHSHLSSNINCSFSYELDIATKLVENVLQMTKNRKKHQQLGFEILERSAVARIFGGSLLRSNPKTKRPITTKRAMHTVLSSEMAKGRYSMFRFHDAILDQVYRQAKKFGVKIYRIANGGNHIHLILLPRSSDAFYGFIRAVTGLIARIVTGAERGNAKGLKFWSARPFTRVVEWGRDFRQVCEYLTQNTLEALGFISYKPRKRSGGNKLAEVDTTYGRAPETAK